jgi:hypothetical protein
MRVPQRLAIQDTFTPSLYTITHPINPGGGDGTFDTDGGNPSVAGVVPVVYFTDITLSGNTSWSWVFKSGATVLGTSNVQNPVFVFPGSGIYQVTLSTNQGTIDHIVTVI